MYIYVNICECRNKICLFRVQLYCILYIYMAIYLLFTRPKARTLLTITLILYSLYCAYIIYYYYFIFYCLHHLSFCYTITLLH